MQQYHGSLVHVWHYRGTIRMAGRLDDGRSFAAEVAPDAAGSDWLTAADAPTAGSTASNSPGETDAPIPGSAAADTAGGATAAGGTDTETSAASHPAGGWQAWDGRELPGPPADLGFSVPDNFLLRRGIRRTVKLVGTPVAATRVDLYFRDPVIEPQEGAVQLRWAALDIETDPDGRITAVSLVCGSFEVVVFHGPELDDPRVEAVDSEQALLLRLAELLQQQDPDVLTGWNVAGFDMAVLEQRFAACRLPFDIGRTGQETAGTRKTGTGLTRVFVPGRQVVDAMQAVRASGRRFADMRLDTVAHAILGEGKTAGMGEATDKLAELETLRRSQPLEYCRYCLHDSRLVQSILHHTGLDRLTEVRAELTGMGMDMAWTSIPVFERLYALELLKRRIVPPTAAAPDAEFGAPGGTVLEPVPGLFAHVLVFDFRSLYPSIMRTFNIDPLSYARAQQHPDPEALVAPNGASFSRDPGILPALLARYFAAREQAIAAGDAVGTHVYKILMNSLYGVLGSAGCIYARRELAGAITGFGRYCLLFARDFFRARGLTVLYGDTDSVFVYAGGQDAAGAAGRYAEELNAALTAQIREEYRVASQISIRFEQSYHWLLLPKLRGADSEQRVRGRAKGYAGSTPDGKLEIRGIEAARSDYTELARRFQTELLELLFGGATAGQLCDYAREFAAQLSLGCLDDHLVYRKVLRRAAASYTHAAPPPVRAARKLGWTRRRGRIAYVMTVQGPEPLEMLHSRLDYRYYIEHQLKPIWKSIIETAELGDSLVRMLQNAGDPAGYSPDSRHPVVGAAAGLDPFSDQLELGFG
ncbi:DNA polymerase elongation subunit (family B) [Spirochaeta africana DSM 8902]|uniref:DNA polymerase n=2 Tax=Spirochaeta TaxID=146 RepID=H9UGS0_SPIAZ|nr:DNA polymerase elongation subunit (family B) [Spirochaeta africana DSM 8902]